MRCAGLVPSLASKKMDYSIVTGMQQIIVNVT